MRFSFFLILAAWFFAACSTHPKPEKRSFRCYVRYVEDRAQLYAEANLLGPDSLPVTPPGGLLFEGLEMNAPPVSGAGFRYQHNGAPTEKAHFSWTDGTGQKHEFALPILPLTDFGFGASSVMRNRPDTLRWKGEALTPGETLVLMWENLEKGTTKPMEIYNTGAQKDIVFPAAKMAELTPGRWTLYLVRKKMVKGDASGVPATGIVEYYTRPDTLEVK